MPLLWRHAMFSLMMLLPRLMPWRRDAFRCHDAFRRFSLFYASLLPLSLLLLFAIAACAIFFAAAYAAIRLLR